MRVLVGAALAALLAGAGCSLEDLSQNFGKGGGGASSSRASQSSSATGMGGSGGVPADWWDPSFTRRLRITVDTSSLAQELDNFALPVRLDAASGLDFSATDGSDFRFVADDQSTVLAHELESFAPDLAVAWVHTDTLGAAPNEVLYLYYGNPSATDASDPAGVWLGSFLSVYHFAQGVSDSAGNIDGTLAGGATATTPASPLAGPALVQTAQSQHATLPDPPPFDVPPGDRQTMSMWFKTANTAQQYLLLHSTNCIGWSIRLNTGGTITANLALGTSCTATMGYGVDSTDDYDDDAWHNVVFVVDRNAQTEELFVDGNLVDQATLPAMGANAGGQSRIGTDWMVMDTLIGAIDEVQISNTNRSQEWIEAHHGLLTQPWFSYQAESL